MSSSAQLRRGRVVVVGTLNVDLVWRVPQLPRPGQTVLAQTVQREFGGKGANQAVAAARQGADVTLIGALGDDADGRLYREHLRRERITDTWTLAAAGVPTGTAHVYVDAHGENLIVVHRGANACLDAVATSAALEQMLQSADILVVQLECPLEAANVAIRLAAEHGVRCVLNASPANRIFAWGVHHVDTVVVNEHECAQCFGVSPSQAWNFSETERQSFLRDRRVCNLVVTQGGEPTLRLSADARHAVPVHAVVPVDTVGAGDTFAGALAAQLAVGMPWEHALRHANVAAALSTLALGAQAAMPTFAQVSAVVAE